MDLLAFSDYVDVLQAEFGLRKKKNPSYSIRAFARDLKTSHSRLSEIFRGQGFFSKDKVKSISVLLKHSQFEKEYCEKLAGLRWEKRKEIRHIIYKDLSKMRAKRKFSVKGKHTFSILDRWYYLPLMEYLTLGVSLSEAAILKKMNISKAEYDQGVHTLKNYGFLKLNADGTWEKSEPILKFETPVPSSAIQEYHRNYLRMAENCITNQSIEQRKLLSGVISIKSSLIDEARAAIEAFAADFSVRFASEDAADAVMNFGIQFFESTERPK
jgi:uncharacterized protein (TIGR02147 family)